LAGPTTRSDKDMIKKTYLGGEGKLYCPFRGWATAGGSETRQKGHEVDVLVIKQTDSQFKKHKRGRRASRRRAKGEVPLGWGKSSQQPWG